MTLQLQVKGVERIARKLGPAGVAAGLRKGLAQGGLIVQESAQKNVHSPDNPYIGKAGYDVSTGRLQASLGTSDVMGSGIALEVRVGTPYGKAGIGTFARSSRRTRTGRTGNRRNRSDVRIYGPIEERKHPFLKPALTDNAARIVDAIHRAIAGIWR